MLLRILVWAFVVIVPCLASAADDAKKIKVEVKKCVLAHDGGEGAEQCFSAGLAGLQVRMDEMIEELTRRLGPGEHAERLAATQSAWLAYVAAEIAFQDGMRSYPGASRLAGDAEDTRVVLEYGLYMIRVERLEMFWRNVRR